MSEIIYNWPDISFSIEEDEAIEFDLFDVDDLDYADDEYIKQLASEYPDYEGQYEVTPDMDGEQLETSNRLLRNNVVVNPIPYSKVTNPSGGYTAIIAPV